MTDLNAVFSGTDLAYYILIERVVMFSLFQPKQLNVNSAYELWAGKYDVSSNFLLDFEKQLKIIRRFCVLNFVEKSLFALDIGCGTGRHLPELEEYFEKVTGIDASKNMLSIAEKKITKQSTSLVHKDFNDFKTDIKFDFINCSLALIHFDNLSQFFNNCSDLLQEDGILYIVDSTESILNKGTVPNFSYDNNLYQIQHLPHSKESLLKATQSAGLELISYKEYSMSNPDMVKKSDHMRHLNVPSLYILIARKSSNL